MRPWTALILVGLAELLGMSVWFAASAISTELQTFWELDSTQGVLLTTFVQIGFVAGTAFAAVLNLADLVIHFTLVGVLRLGGNLLIGQRLA